MGRVTSASETLFDATPDAIYDFVSNPSNWPKTFAGSHGVEGEFDEGLRVGDEWSELVELDGYRCRSTWRLVIAERPATWTFRQVNEIGEGWEGEPGIPGTTTIEYRFTPMNDTQTLFTRSITTEVPRGTRIPDPLLIARGQPARIDAYHDAVRRHVEHSHSGEES